MICKTSEVAVCRSNASLNWRLSRAISVFWSAVVALRRLPTFGALPLFGVAVSGRRGLSDAALTLERRLMAFPKARDYADEAYGSAITSGICGERNGFQGSVCTAAILNRSVHLHHGTSGDVLLYPGCWPCLRRGSEFPHLLHRGPWLTVPKDCPTVPKVLEPRRRHTATFAAVGAVIAGLIAEGLTLLN
jgi:hypothetical protein